MSEDQVIYDESKLPPYVLPDPLVMADGTPVKDAKTWTERRRPEILALFEEHMYGRIPGKLGPVTYEVTSVETDALGGLATRKEVSVYFSPDPKIPKMNMLMYLPNNRKGPVPTFLGLNFRGNHTVNSDPGITITTRRPHAAPRQGEPNHKDPEADRGFKAHKWCMEKVVSRGYGSVTICYRDIDPDYDDGFQNGIHPLFYKEGQTRPAANEWGSIGAWALGLIRAMDYLELDPDIDNRRVAVHGHSRLGKTALWAGALDQRFAMVISANSGCGGDSLSRRRFGETVRMINNRFPHWFCENFKKYNDNEDALPIDQHMLVALIAPRPVYIAVAQDDLWADPRGEFLTALHADPVYRLLGTDGLAVSEMPGVNEPVTSTIGFHMRPGPHNVFEYDWDRFLDFADLHL